ncbi:hypothetical protein OJ998_36050 [Solirubrobacter taibaiensis]|nr:hypothetical protein [Solirubrobacter taibaiensis]
MSGSPEATKFETDTDAIVVPVDDLSDVRGPAAVEDYLLDDLGLVRTDAELDEHEHAQRQRARGAADRGARAGPGGGRRPADLHARLEAAGRRGGGGARTRRCA